MQHAIDDRAIWREIANRVGICGISGEQGRLTTATAKIDFFLGTATARLGHPFRSAESVKTFRLLPDPIELACSHIFETQIGNG
jgi:hypothetical protein